MLLETPTRPSTYNQVLDAYPDMHPELREHVARLALAQGEPLPQPDELLVQSPDNPDGAAASLPKQPFTPAPPESSPSTAEDVDIEKFKHALVRARVRL